MVTKFINNTANLLNHISSPPTPRDWHPALQEVGAQLNQVNRVTNAVIKCSKVFGVKRWDILRKVYKADNKLTELATGNNISIDGVDVVKESWNDVPVFIFTPEGTSETPRSGILYYHGGGWNVCSVELYQDMLVAMAKDTDSVVVSPNYRLAPEHPFPAAYDDCLAVAKRTFEKADDLGIDSSRIALSGDSAGGNLAAAVSLELANYNDKKYQPKYQYLIYPSTDFILFNHKSHLYYKDDAILPRELIDLFKLSYLGYDDNYRVLSALRQSGHLVVDGEIDENIIKSLGNDRIPEKYQLKVENHIPLEESVQASSKLTDDEKRRIMSLVLDRRLSPIAATQEETAKLPSTAVLTCQCDPLQDEGYLYLEKLKEAGVETNHVHLDNLPHGALSIMGQMPSTTEGHEGETIQQHYFKLLREGLST